MPKEAKPSTTSSRRSVPYSVATIKAIAPSSTMATDAATSPQPTSADRHASQAWPPEKDELLMRARHQGLNWQPIATQYFPDKTANACRKRHERLMEKRNNTDSWDGVKMETLARAYINVREQMWKLLADQVGEKWQTVEAKCMEKGLKTLQAAGRTASRRERQHFGGSDVEYEEITDSRYPPPRRDRSKSHQDDVDGSFNDSAIGPEADHPFLIGAQSDQHRSYASSTHNEQAPYSGSNITPPKNSGRSFSISSSTGYTPTITAAPQYSPQPVHYQQSQTLPSFSSAFGVPNIPSISSVIQHQHSPHQHSAVTTR